MPIGENQCDSRCPLIAIRHAEWKQQSAGATIFRKAELAATLGVVGAAQIVRSMAACPFRNATAELWQASNQCAEATLGLLAAGAVDPAKFDAREQQILSPYVNPPGPEAPPPAAA